MKKIKEEAKKNRILKPKVYIVGHANVGKSSFINKLIQSSNRFLSSEKKKKIFYKTHPFEENEIKNMEKNQNKNEENFNEFIEEKFDNEVDLTTSPLPGTTIGITKINSMTMGLKVIK
jgi:ribosome biogenesis GTPase A